MSLGGINLLISKSPIDHYLKLNKIFMNFNVTEDLPLVKYNQGKEKIEYFVYTHHIDRIIIKDSFFK